jgi:hypothetical protein
MIILIVLWVVAMVLAIAMATIAVNIGWALVAFVIWCIVSVWITAYW